MLLADQRHACMCLCTYVNVNSVDCKYMRSSLKTESRFFRNAHEMLFLKMDFRDLFTEKLKNSV